MNARSISAICGLVALSVGLTAPAARADDQNKQSVTVAFGAGLNTISAGAANHHVLPEIIKVKTGGVVNFVVAGFHQIYVYLPGTKPGDLVVPPTGTFINDDTNLYYKGLVPGATSTTFSTTQNRVESVSFSEPGTYLVICNVRGHFLNGMIAYVEVTGGDK